MIPISPNFNKEHFKRIKEEISPIESLDSFLVALGNNLSRLTKIPSEFRERRIINEFFADKDFSHEILPAIKHFVLSTEKLFDTEIFPFKEHSKAISEEETDSISANSALYATTERGIFVRHWSFSREQVACLIANMMYCSLGFVFTVPFDVVSGFDRYWRNLGYPQTASHMNMVINYLKLCYFSPSFLKDSTPVTVSRGMLSDDQYLSILSSMKENSKPLTKVKFLSEGGIGHPKTPVDVEIDFANRCIGFGPFSTQEEILFGTTPEACIAPLVSTALSDSEACFIGGVTHIGEGIGYGQSYKYKGIHSDISSIWEEMIKARGMGEILVSPTSSIPKTVARHSSFMCVDAKCYLGRDTLGDQVKDMDRELKKFLCGLLLCPPREGDSIGSIGTGAWGCGVFRGNKHFKLCLQVLAMSHCMVRETQYFTFSDKSITSDWTEWVSKKNISTINKLFNVLCKYREYVKEGGRKDIFEFE
ncbi:Poly(ADP-ribose) glycohydrolase like protein [Aduncisulcus paluster]|uniref:Poly(ADP-ribose) glycohydrolase like protein n=1 Tax=Aduncisulcus paluster TaxID=2918883 RepID=A0ABQ5JSF5_9EUKA|nr:Poly(ADP-ribose) glycohydrolase like protein [Aduncisulcus paluster]